MRSNKCGFSSAYVVPAKLPVSISVGGKGDSSGTNTSQLYEADKGFDGKSPGPVRLSYIERAEKSRGACWSRGASQAEGKSRLPMSVGNLPIKKVSQMNYSKGTTAGRPNYYSLSKKNDEWNGKQGRGITR